MALLIFLFLVLGEAWVRIGSNDDQCCYLYGSVPHNESNCVPGGREFSLNGIVYNPHDMYTNLTVRWLKANNPPVLTGTSATSPEIISDSHSDYIYSSYNVTSSTINCTDGPLYHDTFSLNILNFTTDKNGYYWYQIFINGSSYQPSQYAWFYADYDLCIQNKVHFKRTDEIKCPNATYLMTSPLVIMSTAAPKMTETGSIPIYYIIGASTMFIILFATMVIVILVIFIRRRHRENGKKTERSKPSPPVHENIEPVRTPNLESTIYSQILLRTSDSREDDTYSIVSDNSQQDHPYDTAQFNNQKTISSNEQPQYNTLQRENASNIPTWSNSTTILFDMYEKINTDGQNCSNLSQSRATRRTDSESEYDVVENSHIQNNILNQSHIGVNGIIQMIPQDYEPVYYNSDGSSNIQTKKLAGKQVLFDDETYGTHKPWPAIPTRAAVEPRMDRVEDKLNSEIVKEETPIANKEVQYAEPLTPNDKNHIIQDVQAEGEHFYHSLELNEPTNVEKRISGHTTDEAGATNAPISFNFDHCEFDDPMYEGIPHSVPKQTSIKNPSLKKMHHEASCIGDVNAHPDMLSHEEDINTPGYSDPAVPVCLNDTNNVAND